MDNVESNAERLLELVNSFLCREECDDQEATIARPRHSNHIKSIGEHLSACSENEPIWLVALGEYEVFLVDWRYGTYTNFIDQCLSRPGTKEYTAGLGVISALLASPTIPVVGYASQWLVDELSKSPAKQAMVRAIVKKILPASGIWGLAKFCHSREPNRAETHREVCQTVDVDRHCDNLAEAIFKSFNCQSNCTGAAKTTAEYSI